jgi:hypothetical protein
MMRRAAIVLASVVAVVFGVHLGVRAASKIAPGPVHVPALAVVDENGIRRAGRSYVRTVDGILEVHLVGSPEEIGTAHSLLLHDEMVATEGVVWRLFSEKVPSAMARALLLDIAGFSYRHVERSMSDARRRELAASALAFTPDPFLAHFDTYQRFVYLTALYDISLGYERSPLVGCTTFTFGGAAALGSPILARNFDFDVDDIFDRKKAVFFVEETGAIPFASVAWAGLVGVVSGMNREGVAVVVHGARAGPTRMTGETVVHELRRVLSTARTTDEAIRALAATDPLVSHIVIVNDAAGHAVAVERVPGTPPFVRALGDKAVVTNHLEGPYASDPKNLRIRQISSTLPRRARGDELLRGETRPVGVSDAIALLRDRQGANGVHLALGDRRAIDALIATHSVVMETATRRLWVSEAPHVLGKFVAFDLPRLFDGGTPSDVPHPELAADPMLADGAYDRYLHDHAAAK